MELLVDWNQLVVLWRLLMNKKEVLVVFLSRVVPKDALEMTRSVV